MSENVSSVIDKYHSVEIRVFNSGKSQTAVDKLRYALAILAVANVLAIPLLSEWIATAISYLPAFIAGLVVIILGFIVADFIGDAIMRTRAAAQTEYTT